MHLADHQLHAVEQLLRRGDHDVDALVEDPKVGVGDQDGDLDQRVAAQIQAGHLAVHPHQPVHTLVRHTATLSARVPVTGAGRPAALRSGRNIAEDGDRWATKSFLRSAATVLGREITRGMLGTATKRRG